ncbi:MAG: valine--tRNA ligase, partial [Candidatus Levybacteria bacterium CG22_combo_CG10-13_8_21_14_all_35_11]
LCYKCKNVLEPLPMEQWFIKVKPLAEKAIKVVKKGKIKIYPKSFEAWYFNWLENLRDWNISRQIVWGIRIPAWKNKNTGEWKVTDGEAPPGNDWEQDKDTFDTWFSSGQWPYLTLQTTRSGDFKEFYPTDVMETAYDILRAWVSRMVMLGLYLTDEVPFKNVLFHGLVNDPYGKKMSKSKGNVINPLELIDQYGADAVRFALIYGNATGNDQSLSYSKLDAARKFTNKLWNMARFINMKREIRNSKFEIRNNLTRKQLEDLAVHKNDKEMIERTEKLAQEITRLLDKYDFNHAAQNLYDFIWHEFADKYIEDVKGRIDENSYFILNTLFLILLKLLHPFMPFVTEDIYKTLWGKEDYLMVSNWPSFV